MDKCYITGLHYLIKFIFLNFHFHFLILSFSFYFYFWSYRKWSIKAYKEARVEKFESSSCDSINFLNAISFWISFFILNNFSPLPGSEVESLDSELSITHSAKASGTYVTVPMQRLQGPFPLFKTAWVRRLCHQSFQPLNTRCAC